MKYNKHEQDGEETPIFPHAKSNGKDHNKYPYSLILKQKLIAKKNIIILYVFLLVIIFLFKLNSKYNTLKENIEKIDKRIELLESQLNSLVENTYNRKLGIAIVVQSLYGNGIGRYLTVLSELLAKTGKYNVYLIY